MDAHHHVVRRSQNPNVYPIVAFFASKSRRYAYIYIRRLRGPFCGLRPRASKNAEPALARDALRQLDYVVSAGRLVSTASRF
jgi:hypothetical protein